MNGLTVLSPVGINRVEARAAAPRISSLEGIRLGLLNNNKPNASGLLEHIASLIGQRFPLGPRLPKQKPNPAVGAENLDVYAREVEAVITALGD